ncbi:hypothetical protein HDU79_000200 [Rhizoclosmatium sp. JEL0117]|nr:hypothetical protein HDU79_000200 [Rhizoclosmatium sp. JEL0117]
MLQSPSAKFSNHFTPAASVTADKDEHPRSPPAKKASSLSGAPSATSAPSRDRTMSLYQAHSLAFNQQTSKQFLS